MYIILVICGFVWYFNLSFIHILLLSWQLAAAAKREAQFQAKREAEEKRKAAAELKRQAQLQAKQKAQKQQEVKSNVSQAKSRGTISLGGTISLFGGGDEEKTANTKSVKSAPAPAPKTKSPTISLFGGGAKSKPAPSPSPVKKVVKKQPPAKQQPVSAPQGVPTLSGWKLNGDGTITGSISGSPNFRNGERVTTSPIRQGRLEKGSVVKTGSGSQYFLG